MENIKFPNLEYIKNILIKYFPNGFESDEEIKSKCLEKGREVEWNEIKMCKIMIKKNDI